MPPAAPRRLPFIRSDPNTAYLAAAGGGVWKTTDGGQSWVPISDRLPSLASGALAIDRLNPATVVYGTGEQHYSSDSLYGDGLFRTVDGGANWSKIALEIASRQLHRARRYLARTPPRLQRFRVRAAPIPMARRGPPSNRPARRGATTSSGARRRRRRCSRPSMGGAFTSRSTTARAGRNWPADCRRPASSESTSPSPTATPMWCTRASSPRQARWPGCTRPSMGEPPGRCCRRRPITSARRAGTTTGWSCRRLTPTRCTPAACSGTAPAASPRPRTAERRGRTSRSGPDFTQVHPDQHYFVFGPDGALWVACDGGVWKTTTGGSSWVNLNNGLNTALLYTVGHPSERSEFPRRRHARQRHRAVSRARWPGRR